MILSNNSINSIASDAFNKCPRLIEIDLSNNLISHITNDTFLNIGPKITRIILNNNFIELLQWNQLSSTLRTIERLVLFKISIGEPFGDRNTDVYHLNLLMKG